MKVARLAVVALLTVFLTLFVVSITSAQDAPPPPVAYFLAADEGGVQQVYQVLLDGEYIPRQVSHANSDVITFGAAYDGLGFVYISDGQLWVQSIHLEEPNALAPVGTTQFLGSPVWSQDGQYLAYTDDGVWLMDMSTRETRQLLDNVPLEESASNADEFRIYQPDMFILGEDGTASNLIVDVGIWEWNTVGVYDLASGELQELEGQVHTDLLPLSDGRVLLYGNGGVAGEFGLHIADSLDDINTNTEALNFADITDATLFAEQAVEIEPGVVRIFGSTIALTPEEPGSFYFDFDIASGEASEPVFVMLSQPEESSATLAGELSPDGTMVPAYLNFQHDEMGGVYGGVKIVDLATGEGVTVELPETVGIFRWQP